MSGDQEEQRHITRLALEAAGEDAGFDLGRFTQNLDNVERIQPEEVQVYGLTASQLDAVKARTKVWAASIRGLDRRESTRGVSRTRSSLSASYPQSPSKAIGRLAAGTNQPRGAYRTGYGAGPGGVER
ncbi:hypothetical protein [Actinomyces gaoshouyii]|uniref:Uncharacterized protein n=1 Tax=Actinomyces gaoshouyii TaxID=1960083 RepID=A0A8H9HB35_9ACTO|nr:hypothetical protein [Actinomyces gaoshouyii]GGO95521.1 hypothetical protein GCM10011612_03550 [Actinomyces gaoshouyii]